MTTELSPAAPLNNEDFQYSAFNFPLLSGSPAIHTGVAISGLTTDYNGNPFATPNPSMGALEYGP